MDDDEDTNVCYDNIMTYFFHEVKLMTLDKTLFINALVVKGVSAVPFLRNPFIKPLKDPLGSWAE